MTRQVRAIIEAIKEGIRTPGMKDELLALEARKAELESRDRRGARPGPGAASGDGRALPPEGRHLHEELNRPELRAEATQALRGLIEEIRLVPEDGQLQIEIAGDLAGILALGDKSKRPARGAGGSQVTLVGLSRIRRTRSSAPRLVATSSGWTRLAIAASSGETALIAAIRAARPLAASSTFMERPS